MSTGGPDCGRDTFIDSDEPGGPSFDWIEISASGTNLNLTDMETCYKLFKTDIIKSLKLKERRFGFEPEVTAKIAKIPSIRIYEVGISYYGRGYEEGKKIVWKYVIRALICILKYSF